MHGPTDMLTGIVAGCIAGVVASCTALWDTRAKRTGIIFLLGMLLMFAGKFIDFSGGGAMASLMVWRCRLTLSELVLNAQAPVVSALGTII